MSYSTSAWKDDLLSQMPGADWTTVNREIQNALREFCIQSGAWTYHMNPITIREGREDYLLNPQPNSMVVYIVGYYLDDGSGDARFYRLRTNAGSPAYSPSIGVIRFVPTPNAEDEGKTFSPIVALRPFNTTFVPDDAVLAWYDVIHDGVIGRMSKQIKKPWTDTVAARYHLRKFRNGIAEFRDIARRKYSVSESEWVYPRGWV